MNQNFEQIRNVQINQNNLNKPSEKNDYNQKKYNLKNKFYSFKPISQKIEDVNLLFFENNNINRKSFFRNLRKEHEKNNSKETLNKININQPLNLKDLNLNNQEKSGNYDNICDSSFSIYLSDLEDDEEAKKENEEIIKKMSKRTDDIIFDKNFNIFDFSKMIDICLLPTFEKEKEENLKNQENDKLSLSTDKTDSNIEIIKIKKDKKRVNNFKRVIKRKKNDKSKSIDRKKERSRSNSLEFSNF